MKKKKEKISGARVSPGAGGLTRQFYLIYKGT